MIRLALVSHLSELSGAGVSLVRIARSLDRERFAAELILPGKGPLYDFAQRAGVAVAVLENPEESLAAASASRKIVLALKRLAYLKNLAHHLREGQFDVVYINTTITVVAGLAAWLARKPMVWHVRELLEHPTRTTRLKMATIERLADAIFFASHASMRAFPAERVAIRRVIRNVVEVEKFLNVAPQRTLADELGIRRGEAVITSNGVFPRKAPDLFLRAAAIVSRETERPLRWLLVGPALDDHRAYYEEMKKLAKELGLADKVTFTGLRTDMPAILALTDVFVSPSRNEAQPNVLNEAMVAGVPVVATDVGDCREMLRQGEWGEVVPPEDPAALAQAILRILANPERARERARKAQEALVREYTAPEFWRPVEEVLEHLARKD